MKLFVAVMAIAGGTVIYNMMPPHADQALIRAEQPVLTEKGNAFVLDTAASTVTWVGTKPSGQHVGNIKISAGTMEVKKETIKSGSFTIDMTTITDNDMKGSKGQGGLEKHLKSADFFDVEKFPTASFEITGIAKLDGTTKPLMEGATHNVSGNLTMKGITKNITFPAIIAFNGKQMKAQADFNIDRTQWGVNYGTVGGKVATDINLKLDIVANN